MGAIACLLTADPKDIQHDLTLMLRSLVHRGADESSEVIAEDGVGLGARDAAESSQQPAWDEKRSFAAVIDGHIYNASELRQQLEALGHRFAGREGTAELVAHAYEQWGAGLAGRLDGPFALAVWDRQQQRFFLARDRFGEKPLLVARLPGGYAIASELRALLALPAFTPKLDLLGLDQYLALRRPMAPRTMLEGVQQLPAGYHATLTRDSFVMSQYWQMTFAPRSWAWPDLLEQFDAAMDTAVKRRVAGNASAGVFLSGGLDSTAVAYYLARNDPSAQAFTAGFDVTSFDETELARETAEHLGLPHHAELISQDSVPELVQEYAGVVDEPLTPGDALSRYLIARVAAGNVKAAFAGDGGDELRMSIGRLYRLPWLKQRLPGPLRALLEAGNAPRLMQADFRPQRARRLYAIMRTKDRRFIPGLSNNFTFEPREILSQEVRSHLPESVLTEVEPVFAGIGAAVPDVRYRSLAGLMRISFQDDAVKLLDRVGMAASLELQLPFVDAGVIDLLATVPAEMRMQGPTGHNILRELMQGKLPDPLIDRRKKAFFTPMAAWLRGPLKPLLLEYAAPERLRADGIFHPARIARVIDEHMSGRRDHHVPIRYFLMLELWRERWLGRR